MCQLAAQALPGEGKPALKAPSVLNMMTDPLRVFKDVLTRKKSLPSVFLSPLSNRLSLSLTLILRHLLHTDE